MTGSRSVGRGRLIAVAALGLIASGLWLPVVAARMAGTPAWPVDSATVRLVVTQTAAGRAWIVREAALLAALAALLRDGVRIAALASGLAVATLAWTGHGVVGEGLAGAVHLAADLVHLLASAGWIGALFALAARVFAPAMRVDAAHRAATARALRGFGPVGTVLVLALAASGLVNGWFLVGPAAIGALPSSGYGRLLLAKLALFAAMLALAAVNRWRLTPALTAGGEATTVRALRLSLAVEACGGTAILALVAWLGTLEPPIAM